MRGIRPGRGAGVFLEQYDTGVPLGLNCNRKPVLVRDVLEK